MKSIKSSPRAKIKAGARGKPFQLLLLALLLLGLTVSGHGQVKFKPLFSYYNFSFGTRALGMGNAFTAVADDLSAVFWNPAGAAEFKYPEVYLDYRGGKIGYAYAAQSDTSGDVTQQYSYQLNSTLKNVDFVAISVPAYFWDMKWTFALSYYRLIPYGMNGTSLGILSGDSETSTTESETWTFDGSGGIDVLGFTAAYYFSDYFSLGITLQQFVNSGTVDYRYTSIGEETRVGYAEQYTEKVEGRNIVLGAIFKPMRDVVIGITYRTRLSNTFDSQYTLTPTDDTAPTTSTSKTDFVMPARLSFGLLIRPFQWWNVSCDYSIIYWGLGSISSYYGAADDLEYPVRNDFSFSQEDYVNFRLGTQFRIPYGRLAVFLRAGIFSEQPLFTDSDGDGIKVKGFSFGAGVELSPLAAIDVAYMRRKATWNEAAYFSTATTPTVVTTFENDIVSVSLTLRWGRPE